MIDAEDCIDDCTNDPASATDPPDRSDTRQDHDRGGRFTAGNAAARKHGLYSRAAHLQITSSFADWQAQVIADMGGEEALTAVELGAVRRLCDAEAVAALARQALATAPITTAAGQKLAGLLLNATDRYIRVGLFIGRERRPRAISPLDAVRMAVEKANQR